MKTGATHSIVLGAVLLFFVGMSVCWGDTPDLPRPSSSPGPSSDRSPDPAAASEGTDMVKVSGTASPAPDSSDQTLADTDLLQQIEKEEDLFSLHELAQTYEKRDGPSEWVRNALRRRMDLLAASCTPQPMIEGCVDFVAFDFRRLHGSTYRLSWYFLVRDTVGGDWRFRVRLAVDPIHAHLLPGASLENPKDFIYYRVYPEESGIRNWKPGEHRVISIERTLSALPYNIASVFHRQSPEGPMVYSRTIQHGWHADLDE